MKASVGSSETEGGGHVDGQKRRWRARATAWLGACIPSRPAIAPATLLLICQIGLAAALAGGTAGLVLQMRSRALAQATDEMQSLSVLLADQAERTFLGVELAQANLLAQLQAEGVVTPDQFRRFMSGTAIYDEIHGQVQMLPQLDAISAIDADGALVNFSRYWPIPQVNVADRDYFKVLRADPAQTTFISQPVANRGDGTWSIYLAHRVSNVQGEFLGLILCALKVATFEQLYQTVAGESGTGITLFRKDGVLLGHYPQHEKRDGVQYRAANFFVGSATDARPRPVNIRLTSLFDDKERMLSAVSLIRFPLAVTVSRSVSDVLAPWTRQAGYLIISALVFELVFTAVGRLMLRQLRSQSMLTEAHAARTEAEAARRGVEAELAVAHERERGDRERGIQNLRFSAAVNNMSQALCLCDAADRVVVANGRLAEMFGLEATGLTPGTTFDAFLDRIADGPAAADTGIIKAVIGRLKTFGQRGTQVRELPDGRILAVNFAPVDDQGWLVTIEDITERRLVEARIAHMAMHDALTGLPNRSLFHERLGEAVARSRRGEPSAVLYLDLDHFKAVNDTLGHPVGDALLREVTRRLQQQVREIDTVARLGGDEFAIVQVSADQPKDATTLATRLIDELTLPYDLDGQHVVIGTSIGIAVIPHDGADPDELLKNADLALYRAKADGRGRYRFFEPAMDALMQQRRALELDLRRALANEEFEVFYQPQVSLKTNSVIGFEALVRWRSPERGLVGPGDFVPLAEEIGLIVPLGEWVLRRACADAMTWPGELKVAVNLSPVQFGSRTLVADVAAALAGSGLPPARLELEITETVMLEDTEAVLVLLHRLRDLGVSIAMDDFGTGYSSLSYLRRFPFDKVKIDRSFVEGLGQAGDCDAIVTAVTDLCESLGMTTTAEGVETDHQLQLLSAGNCTLAQGYLFSRPLPADKVSDLCRRLSGEARVEAQT